MPQVALQRGWHSYAALCASCHGAQGEGRPHVAPALQGNASLRLTSPNNLLVAMLDGVEAQHISTLENMQAMPGMPNFVSDQEVADLANVLRTQWGGVPSQVSAATVKKLR
jgi:mono/diheme cytochrome c family protein